MRRILITGSRSWPAGALLWGVLDAELAWLAQGEQLTVVHGGARGVDMMAGEWVLTRRGYARDVRGIPLFEERHPVVWSPHGIYNPSAGLARNIEMVKLGADVCYAFIHQGSRGATHCAEQAELAGIPTFRVTT